MSSVSKKRKKAPSETATRSEDTDEADDPRVQAQRAVPMERRRNLAFEAYYRAQIFYDNTSRDASYYASRETQPYGDAVDFFAALAQPSPMTLRIHMTRPLVVQQQTAKELANPPVALSSLNWVQQLLPAALMSRSTNSGRVASDEIEKGSDVGAVAWECGHDLYHTQAGLEAWCKAAHKGGTVNFQESVSLLPALLLRLEPHHAVADLCAAPGSKTTQALDLMHRLSSRLSRPKSSDKNDGTSACSFPSGFVIANEFDAKRARLYLAGRVRRVDTPCCAIVCGAAQSLPLDNAFGGTFDRVMADVPCSGDGTLRKDPRLWSGWSPRDALELHTVQLKILRRALAMLKPGGIVAYSTCSFNPIENEAVVCAALVGARAEVDAQRAARKQARKDARAAARREQRKGGPCDEIVDDEDDEDDDDEASLVPDEYEVVPAFGSSGLPQGLRVAPGLTSWKVPLIPGGPTARRWGPALHATSSHYGTGGSGASHGSGSGGGGPGACYAFQRGECRRGDKCRFSHATGAKSDVPDSSNMSNSNGDNSKRGGIGSSGTGTISASSEHASTKPDETAAAADYDETGWWSEDLEAYLARGAAAKVAAASSGPNSATKAQPHHPKGLKRSMFPAVGAYARMNDQLRHACRLLPHFHDGGGFFVCLIQRRHSEQNDNASSASADATTAADEDLDTSTTTTAAAGRVRKPDAQPVGSAVDDSKASHQQQNDELSKPLQPLSGVISPIDGGLGGEPWAELASFYGLSDVALGRRAYHPTIGDETMEVTNASLAAAAATELTQLAPLAQEIPQLCVEGPRVVLCSAGLVRFLARLEAASKTAAAAGGSGYHPSVALHSAGLRVFLKMSDGAFRSAAICRWRPCQEGAAWLASVATRRKVRFSPVSLRALLEHQMLPASVLIDLEAAGHATGITEELLASKLHQPREAAALGANSDAATAASATSTSAAGTDAPSGGTASSAASLRAGGLLVGLLSGAPGCPGLPSGLVEPSHGEEVEAGGSRSAAAPAAWCWVACVASTMALHVYADANSLHPLRSLLGNGNGSNGSEINEKCCRVGTILAAYQGSGLNNDEGNSEVVAKSQRMELMDD